MTSSKVMSSVEHDLPPRWLTTTARPSSDRRDECGMSVYATGQSSSRFQASPFTRTPPVHTQRQDADSHPLDTPAYIVHICTCHRQSARRCPLRPLLLAPALVSMPGPELLVGANLNTFVVGAILSASFFERVTGEMDGRIGRRKTD